MENKKSIMGDKKEFTLLDGNIMYHGNILTDEQIVNHLNQLKNHCELFRKERDEAKKELWLSLDVIDGVLAFKKLKDRGYFE